MHNGGIQDLLLSFGGLVSLAIPITAGLALVYFFYGIAKFITHAGDEGAQVEAKNVMLWGIIALFVIVSIWGIVHFIQDNIGIRPILDINR